MIAIYTAVFFAILIAFIACSVQSVSDIAEVFWFYCFNGYSRMFRSTSNLIFLILVPVSIGNVLCTSFASSKLICAMARSGLYPAIFGETKTIPFICTSSPVFSISLSTSITLCASFLLWYFQVTSVQSCNAAVLFSSVAYVLTFLSFIMLRSFFRDKEKQYHSFTGVVGACFGIAYFTATFIAVFVRFETQAIFIFVSVFSSSIMYYIFFGRKRQRLSPEESNTLMVAHVIKGNIRVERRRKREAVIRTLTAMGISYIREMRKPLHDIDTKPDPYLKNSKHYKEIKYHSGDRVYVVLPEITLSNTRTRPELDHPKSFHESQESQPFEIDSTQRFG
jgi:amino acid transporter